MRSPCDILFSLLQEDAWYLFQLTWIPNEISDFDMTIVTFLDRTMNAKGTNYPNSSSLDQNYNAFAVHTFNVLFLIFCSAWLARLWEITVKSGLVVIVSKQDAWNKHNLAQYFGNK